MARLNEAPQPAPESIESLKRRFIRQNRDLARVNSSQSIRIKNLEAHISQLISENANLRQQVLSTQREVKRYQYSAHLPIELMYMKRKLKSKLTEVDALLNEFDSLPERAESSASARRAEHRRHGNRSSHISNVTKSRPEQPRRQAEETEEARLPVIMEHKYYPRRTLEVPGAQEAVAEDENESPEIGPPPVAHFEEADCIGFDVNRSPRRTSRELIAESERKSLDHVESRRKRRTSSLVLLLDTDTSQGEQFVEAEQMKRMNGPQETKADRSDRPNSVTKTGTKRKLSVSEIDEAKRSMSKERDEPSAERKTSETTSTTRPSRFTKAPAQQAQENGGLELASSSATHPPTGRKILAPKTTNSPAKRVISSTNKPELQRADIDSTTSRRAITRIRARPSASIAHSGAETTEPEVQARQTTELPPKTPAADGLDTFSPISAESSTQPKRPSELAPMTSVEDVLNGSMGRASRRVRSAVSYAEPSLRDKMRRPGKELVGAVEGLAKPAPTADREKSTGVPLQTDGRSRSEAASPLRDKRGSSTISTTNTSPPSEDLLKEAVSRLSLLDHHESNSITTNSKPTSPVVTNTAPRRSSSNPTLPAQIPGQRPSRSSILSNRQDHIDVDVDHEADTTEIRHHHHQPPLCTTTATTALNRRRSMMV